MHHIFMAYSMQAHEAAPSDPYPGSSCMCVCVRVCVCVCMSCVHMRTHSVAFNYFATPWTIAHQPPLSMWFSRQKYWSVFSSLGDLRHPWIEPTSLASPALAGGFFTTAPPGKPGSSLPPWCIILEHITVSCPHLLNNTHTHTHTHTHSKWIFKVLDHCGSNTLLEGLHWESSAEEDSPSGMFHSIQASFYKQMHQGNKITPCLTEGTLRPYNLIVSPSQGHLTPHLHPAHSCPAVQSHPLSSSCG